jgi:DivIVA domain-containing protein
VVDDESSKDVSENLSPAAAEEGHGFGELRPYVPADILDVSFPFSVRGYERRAVDAYIERVNRVIAELKVSASAPAAVRHALEQAGRRFRVSFRPRRRLRRRSPRARQEAEESSARAKAEATEFVVDATAEADRVKAEADETLAQARAEAQNSLARAQAEADERRRRLQEELAAQREQAETRMRELQADTDAVWKERRALLADVRGTASGLVELASAAATRFPRGEPGGPEEKLLVPAATDKTESPRVTPDESTRVRPAGASHAGGDDESHDEPAERTVSGPDT